MNKNVLIVSGVLVISCGLFLSNFILRKTNETDSHHVESSAESSKSEKEDKNEEQDYTSVWQNPDEGAPYVEAKSDEAIVTTGSLVDALNKYFADQPAYTDYGQSDESWNIESLEKYASYSNKFYNLYSFYNEAKLTEDKSIPVPGDSGMTIDYKAGDSISIVGFATVEDDKVTIHKIDVGNELLINDNFVDDYMYSIMQGFTGASEEN